MADRSKVGCNKSLLFSASDLIGKVYSLYLQHQEYRLDANGDGGTADGVRVTGKVLVVAVAGRHRVSRRTGCIPDGLGLGAGGVLEAAGPDDGGAGDKGAV